MATAVARVRETSVLDESVLLAVAERLQSSLHLPAVREALRCLIPEWLDPALDDKQRKGPRSDADRVGVKIACKGLRADVSAESVLRTGRRMDKGVLELFLRALNQVCRVLELPPYVGTHRLGAHIGGPVPTEQVARLVGRWVQFGHEEQARARNLREFLLPVVVDSDGGGKSSDWMFLRLRSADAACTFNECSGLAVDEPKSL